MKNLAQKQAESVKKERPGMDFILFVLGLACFTFALGTAAHLYDSKYPKTYPCGVVVNTENSDVYSTDSDSTHLAMGGFPGPIIDIHIEYPVEIPTFPGVGPNEDIYLG